MKQQTRKRKYKAHEVIAFMILWIQFADALLKLVQDFLKFMM